MCERSCRARSNIERKGFQGEKSRPRKRKGDGHRRERFVKEVLRAERKRKKSEEKKGSSI